MTSETRPIFVVGAPRSGTTLVSKILGRHAKVLAAGETHFFETIWANRKAFGGLESRAGLEAAVSHLITVFDRFNQVQAQALVDRLVRPEMLVERTLQYGGGYDGLYRAFTSSLDESGDQLRYCDDTPKHLFYLGSILDFFPEARVIICIRDPRDFLCSYKNFWRASRDPERIKALYHPIITAMLWRSSANVILNDPLVQQSKRIMTLHYESLVAEPAVEVKRMCIFSGLDYNDGLLSVESHNSAFDQIDRGIYRGSVGKWAEGLSAEEVWWVERLNRRQMEGLGYGTAEMAASPAKVIGILLSTPVGLLKALRANSGRRGPLVNYIVKRVYSR